MSKKCIIKPPTLRPQTSLTMSLRLFFRNRLSPCLKKQYTQLRSKSGQCGGSLFACFVCICQKPVLSQCSKIALHCLQEQFWTSTPRYIGLHQEFGLFLQEQVGIDSLHAFKCVCKLLATEKALGHRVQGKGFSHSARKWVFT